MFTLYYPLFVIPWLDHGIQKKIKKDRIPRSSRRMTIFKPQHDNNTIL
ncbi:hypothetical protein [Candidatus Rickettsia kedanie]